MSDRPAPRSIRLHLNENSAGCSPAVLAALHALSAEDVGRYPDIDRATARCASHFGVPAGGVVLTNGLDDGVYAVARQARERWAAGSREPFEAIVIEPAFESYAAAVEGAGGVVRRVVVNEDFSFPLDDVLAAIGARTALIYVNDPNNPTGRGVPAEAIVRIVHAAPNALVVVDEAYADFRGRSILGSPIARAPNLIVGRTFSKVYGLAGLRIGALIGRPETIAPLQQRRPRFGVNTIAVLALAPALADRAYYSASVAAAAAARQAIYDWCQARALRSWPSEANFVLVRLGSRASAVAAALAARGILISDRSTLPRCEGCVRISASRTAEVQAALGAIEAVIEER